MAGRHGGVCAFGLGDSGPAGIASANVWILCSDHLRCFHHLRSDLEVVSKGKRGTLRLRRDSEVWDVNTLVSSVREKEEKQERFGTRIREKKKTNTAISQNFLVEQDGRAGCVSWPAALKNTGGGALSKHRNPDFLRLGPWQRNKCPLPPLSCSCPPTAPHVPEPQMTQILSRS